MPSVALSPNARLYCSEGTPMLSMIISMSSAGMILRISASTAEKIFSVSSRRVPLAATTCMRIWPASTVGKKSRPIHGQRDEGAAESMREGGEHGGAMAERPGERIHVEAAEALEGVVEAPCGCGRRSSCGVAFSGACDLAREQVFHQHRHDRAREDVAREDREDDRERERHEEELRRAFEQHDRDEDDADRERGDEGGHGDLLRAVEDRLLQRFPHREVAVDVFDLDRGVIDEDADGQREAAEGHHVDANNRAR